MTPDAVSPHSMPWDEPSRLAFYGVDSDSYGNRERREHTETTGETPHVLADPQSEHRLPESDEPCTATERAALSDARLENYTEDRNVLAAFRAGWDGGVRDLSDALGGSSASTGSDQ